MSSRYPLAVAFSGSRELPTSVSPEVAYDLFDSEISAIMVAGHDIYDMDLRVGDAAAGLDQLARLWLLERELEHTIYCASHERAKRLAELGSRTLECSDWDRDGARAGMLRNCAMLAQANLLVALWNGTSRGTLHAINLIRALPQSRDHARSWHVWLADSAARYPRLLSEPELSAWPGVVSSWTGEGAQTND